MGRPGCWLCRCSTYYKFGWVEKTSVPIFFTRHNCTAHNIFQDISVSVSVLTLTFIAYDRYHAICKPLEFSSRKRKAAWIAAIW